MPRSFITPRRAIGAGVAAVLIGSSITALASTAATPSLALAALPSVIPNWATTAKVVGATPGNQTVFVGLTLKAPDEAGMEAYGKAATTPGNALYHHYLSVAQFQARFAPAAATVATVTSALKALGITDLVTDKLGMSIMATMPASVASTVFGVRFQQVMHGGISTRVAMNQPTLPSALLSSVTAVSGLTQERVHLDHTVDSAAQAAVPAKVAAPAITVPGVGAPTGLYMPGTSAPYPGSSSYYGQTPASDTPMAAVRSGETAPAGATTSTKPYIITGYTPTQLRSAYGVSAQTLTGKGITAGVVLFYDGQDVPGDLATFSTAMGLAAPSYTDLSPENQVTSDVVGNEVLDPLDAAVEQTLDVEAIHQMAPDASLIYSGAVAPEDEPIYVAEDTAIVGGAQVINNSYGGTGDTDAADAQVFATAVTGPAMVMGVGLDYSSGDSSDDVTADGLREADFPTTSDEVTSVGGTGLEVGKNNDYEGEFYWGTYSTPALAAGATSWGTLASQAGGAGGGGGLSTAFAEPSWQQGVVPAEETENADTAKSAGETTGIGATTPGRVVPDVSMLADSTTGILVGETLLPDVGTDGVAGDGVATYSYFRIGGTSVSSPLFTGVMALVDQALTNQAGGTLTSAGFPNPTMYPFLARGNGAFRDPHIGRAATASRLGGTMAQSLTGCTAGSDGTDATQTCAGTGPGVIPVVSEVRPDYVDGANPGIANSTSTPAGGVGTNTVVKHLRGQSILGTLEDLPGYDDSTGLGSPCVPQFINDFLNGQPSAGSYCTADSTTTTPTPTPTPISAPIVVTSKPAPVSCSTVRTSTIKVYGPKTTKLNSHGQSLYTFKLFVNNGKCKAPSPVGRQFYVYVDKKKTAVLRTGKNGVQTYLVRLTPGKHTITASFVGNKDLKKSASAKFTARAV